MKTLFLIPARGGSKGIPRKNIKLLNGKPLINYSIEFARNFADDIDICVSTDDQEIINVVGEFGLEVPFVRPEAISTDTASSFDVMKHALHFYAEKGIVYQKLVLLQPTSPIRLQKHYDEANDLFDEKTEVIVSVINDSKNPYYNLYELNPDNFLKISKGEGKYSRRQDCPKVYSINGNIYIFKVEKLLKSNTFSDFENIQMYEMEEKFNVDLDTLNDWNYCEYLISNKLF